VAKAILRKEEAYRAIDALADSTGESWFELGEKLAEKKFMSVLDKLEKTAGMKDIRGRIRVESSLTPQDIHDRYRVLNGAIYGLASHGRLTGAFKPANRSPDVPGLYLAGGAAHPGPGMPMVLMSGWIAGDVVDKDLCGSRASRLPVEAV
jgi:phytoene dehydrogenase-like protein